MSETDIEQPTGKLRICRTPGCLYIFDPNWRVRVSGQTADICPMCGADLTRNSFIRRADEGAGLQEG
jgi:hypothetical protein